MQDLLTAVVVNTQFSWTAPRRLGWTKNAGWPKNFGLTQEVRDGPKNVGVGAAEGHDSRPHPNAGLTLSQEREKNWKKRDFEIQEKLGEGKYGEVRKAVSVEDKNAYAVKKIRKGKNTTVALIRNEIELQKNSSAYYLQLELVEGGELFDLMHSYGKFSEDTARFYAAEILCALEYIHDNDIVFRDLKPGNILLTSEGHIKLHAKGVKIYIQIGALFCEHSFCGTPSCYSHRFLGQTIYCAKHAPTQQS
ncbi:protein kinase domain-containing protein [Ditylenchus destructor]|uniref:Serine/threonine-protein kinase greatwall n=1 Tax=Ditylenchus destructor TaxID=166010 RepID=A0AAD4MH61_9BILA|nr:protein kinase domain-containing protein [Ditylenchus destructor]